MSAGAAISPRVRRGIAAAQALQQANRTIVVSRMHSIAVSLGTADALDKAGVNTGTMQTLG